MDYIPDDNSTSDGTSYSSSDTDVSSETDLSDNDIHDDGVTIVDNPFVDQRTSALPEFLGKTGINPGIDIQTNALGFCFFIFGRQFDQIYSRLHQMLYRYTFF